MKERIGKAVFWMVWSRSALHGLSFLSTLLVIRMLSPADFGLMAMAGVWIAILTLVVEVDLGSAIIQFPDLDDTELNVCFWLTTCLTISGGSFLVIIAPAIAGWFSAPMLEEILPIVALTLPLAGAKVVPYSLLKKRLELDKVAKTEIAASLFSIPIVLAMAWLGFGVWALVVGSLLPLVVQSIGSFWFVKWRPGFQLRGGRVVQMLHFSLKTSGSNIMWAILVQSAPFILGKLAGEALLGIYSIAMEIATTLTSKIAMMVQQLAFPVMAELQADSEALLGAVLKGIRLIAFFTFPISIGMLLLAADFVFVVMTEKWVSIIPVLQILSMFALLQSIFFIFPIVLKVRYRVTFLLYFNLALLGVLPVAFWVAAEFFASLGVALVWVTIYPILFLWLVREASREIGMRWTVLWRQISLITGATVVMASVVLILQWLLPGEDLTGRVIRMVLAVCLGGFSYGAVIFFPGGLVSLEVREVAGWLLGIDEALELRHLVSFWHRLTERKERYNSN